MAEQGNQQGQGRPEALLTRYETAAPVQTEQERQEQEYIVEREFWIAIRAARLAEVAAIERRWDIPVKTERS